MTIQPTGLHILLTYQCNFECDHCFVWGGPWQTGVFTWARLEEVYRQAVDLGTFQEFFFEGGEAFLYHPLLVRAIARGHELGFRTGIVSNGYWATDAPDAHLWLEPLARAGLDELDVSCDAYHGDDEQRRRAQNAIAACEQLDIAHAVFELEPPSIVRSAGADGDGDVDGEQRGAPVTGGGIMFRGRAAVKLTEGLPGQPWDVFDACPYENLTEPSRLHVDPFGNIHLCQGLVIGNLFERPLKQILHDYQPTTYPIVGDLIGGGPAQIVRSHGLPHEPHYVDACHLCYSARLALRSGQDAALFQHVLAPDQMYGVA